MNNQPPGANIYRLRNLLDVSIRELAEHTRPSVHYATISRIENGGGFTKYSLSGISFGLATLFRRPISVQDIMLPTELYAWPLLDNDTQKRIANQIGDETDRKGE